jgi:branched-chain amino acid transport system substrate-binding protein
MSISRRKFLANAAIVSSSAMLPALVRPAKAQGAAIRIGVPTGITGQWAALGQQVQRACRLYAKAINAKGGINGRQLEFLFEDTQGDPAACVRKTTELVERGGVNLITGIISSGESLAVMPRLNDLKAIYMATIAGVGSLTAGNFVPNAFRACTSGPMRTRTISLWLQDSPRKRFFSIAQDYAWGKSSVGQFDKLITGLGKQVVGSVLSPLGTKDYSSYITRIREANPEVLFVAMSGDDATAFLKQAGQYRLSERMQMVTEVLDLLNTKPLGDTAPLGLSGISQYNFALETRANAEFVRLFKAEYNDLPDTWEGEMWQALDFLSEAIRRAKSTEAGAVRAALEDLEIDSVKGKVRMRACDHQAEQPVYMAQLKKVGGVAYPVPVIEKTYPVAAVMPGCRKDSY